MASWQWIAALRGDKPAFDWRFVARFSLKVVVCIIVFNVLWVVVNPLDRIEQFSLYNTLVPGRPRASQPLNLNELFTASPISLAEPYQSEYRVIFLGDSSIWGVGLRWDHTLPGCLNQDGFRTPDGRLIKAFNLSYPAPSMLRDLITLRRALNYHVDHIVWIISGVGMDRYRMFAHPLLQENLTDLYDVLDQYPIAIPGDVTPPPRYTDPANLLHRTFLGQRAELLTWIQAQMSAFTWLQTGMDGPDDAPPPPPRKFVDRADLGDIYNQGRNRGPGDMTTDDFMFDSLVAGQEMAAKAGVKLTIILQPMWSAPPGTTHQRYNEFYPFWFFDVLHSGLQKYAAQDHWDYLDWSLAIDNDLFTDSPFHYTSKAACELADRLGAILRDRSTT